MKTAALLAALLALALGGCDKQPSQARSQPAAASQAQSPMKPVKVMEEVKAQAQAQEYEVHVSAATSREERCTSCAVRTGC